MPSLLVTRLITNTWIDNASFQEYIGLICVSQFKQESSDKQTAKQTNKWMLPNTLPPALRSIITFIQSLTRHRPPLCLHMYIYFRRICWCVSLLFRHSLSYPGPMTLIFIEPAILVLTGPESRFQPQINQGRGPKARVVHFIMQLQNCARFVFMILCLKSNTCIVWDTREKDL